MKISFEKYPIDIIICILWSVILLPIGLLDIESSIRTILGLPFILFIPGYVLVFALFPSRKTDRGIDVIERIALSFGLSIAVVPLIGLGLNYTPWGIRLEPILLSIFIFIVTIGIIGIYRWFKTNMEERFVIKADVSFPKSENKVDRILTVILIITIIIAMVALIYVIVTPKVGEKFTEFYVLGPKGVADDYPQDLLLEENGTVIIGVVNHEYKTFNYTIEIWLINQSQTYNETTKQNETVYNHMWFFDKFTVSLKHVPINIEESWKPQWEKNYTFSVNRRGDFKLAFLLFSQETEAYNKNFDYKNIAKEKIESAYRNLHLWLNVE